MKQPKVICFIVVLVVLLCQTQSWAGDTYYKNLSFAVKNPETAKGKVYLTPDNVSDVPYCTISDDPKIAKVEGNISNSGNRFILKMFALPADGYVLDCLSTSKNPTSNNKVFNTRPAGYPMSSAYLHIDKDTTTNCTKKRPEKGAKFHPVSVQEYYAIFVPSKKASVRNLKAGSIASAVKACQYGEATNDLIVTGPLNKDDIKYLNYLSQEKSLVRLDLSGATLSVVPDSAFYSSGLYELKLPSSIKSVGNAAFSYSMGLKPVKLPSGIIKDTNKINGCLLMNLMGVKEETTSTPNDLFELYENPLMDWLLN